ncbi:hypothetical protein WJX74_010224 [Apatococcus lobatus]|uniref:Uncharacterized protein n=1 Tax=Apatococcus lobatus TaxID=904363 RepID=A0AAW1RYE6_9CHLO
MAPAASHNINFRNWNCSFSPGWMQWLRRLSSDARLKSRPGFMPCSSSRVGNSPQSLPDFCSSHDSRQLANLEALTTGFWMRSEVLRLPMPALHADGGDSVAELDRRLAIFNTDPAHRARDRQEPFHMVMRAVGRQDVNGYPPAVVTTDA